MLQRLQIIVITKQPVPVKNNVNTNVERTLVTGKQQCNDGVIYNVHQ